MLPLKAVQWVNFRLTNENIKKFQNSKKKTVSRLVGKIDAVEANDTASKEEKKKALTTLGEGLSLIHVYFKDLEVVKYSKEENYGLMDVIGKLES